MTSPFLDLLKQIADGVVVIYEPFHRDAHRLREFQHTLHRLQEMQRLGLINRLFAQTRFDLGAEYIAPFMVQGGLTLDGKHLLAKQEV